MVSDSIFISRKGYQKMMGEIEELKSRRPKISAAIKEALEKGDLKENAEYHAAKEELAHVQRRIAELESRLAAEPIREVILALPTDVEGDATSHYLARRLAPRSVNVTRLAHGLPAGTGLEFADDLTLSRALEGRQSLI